MKIIRFFLRRILFSAFLLYLYNFIAVPYFQMVPVNEISLAVVSVLGSFGLLGLILFQYLL